jgi:hypothetical protein
MIRTIAAAVFALLTVTASAHAATIQWDFFGVGNNPVVVGGTYPNNTYATVSVAGYFDYDTTTGGLASVAHPFDYQFYYNGSLASICTVGCDLFLNNNTISLGAIASGVFTLTAPQPLDGSVPIMSGTNGFLYVFAPNGTSATGAFVEGKTIQTPPPQAYAPLPDALPLFGTALLALGGFAWRSRQQRG